MPRTLRSMPKATVAVPAFTLGAALILSGCGGAAEDDLEVSPTPTE